MIRPPFTEAKLKILAKGLRVSHASALKAFAEFPDGMPASGAFPAGLLSGVATLGFCERFEHLGAGETRWRLTDLGVAVVPHLKGGR